MVDGILLVVRKLRSRRVWPAVREYSTVWRKEKFSGLIETALYLCSSNTARQCTVSVKVCKRVFRVRSTFGCNQLKPAAQISSIVFLSFACFEPMNKNDAECTDARRHS